MFISPRLVDSYSELEHKLQDSFVKYDWYHRPNTDSDMRNATGKWDDMQSNYACCGVHSYKDWDPFRPVDVPDMYPRSCCNMTITIDPTNKEVCTEKAVYPFGCVEGIKMVNVVIAWLLTALIIMNLVLGAMASIVVFCRPDPSYERY